MSTVAVKNVDQALYRKVKALASLRGATVGEVVNEALSLWVQMASKGGSFSAWVRLEEEAREDNEAYEGAESDLLADHLGEFAVVGGGKVLGTFRTLGEACALAARSGLDHAIVTRLQAEHGREVELGWGLAEQSA